MQGKSTQNERIVAYMLEFGGITQLDALRDLGCLRLASRISDIRKKGVPIESEMIPIRNRYDEVVHVKRYSIRGDEYGR